MKNRHDTKEYQVKLILLGDANVGKSSIICRYIHSSYNNAISSTIGASFYSKIMTKNNKIYRFEIWDTAGQERYEALIPMYSRGANVALVVYDITSILSFEKAKKWITCLTNDIVNMPLIVLIGNKADLKHNRKVLKTDVLFYVQENKLLFYETSVLDNNNSIKTIFDNICDIIDKKKKERKDIIDTNINLNDNKDSHNNGCFRFIPFI